MVRNADPSRKTTVFVVNDEPTQRRLLESLLTKEGMDVRGFMTAGEALEQLASKSNTPDLIVTDLHMPGIDGWRFCRLLRSPEYPTFNKVPILIVSATYAGEDVRKVCMASGANAFLPLPVSGRHFLSQVGALLAGKPEPIPVRLLVVEDSTTLASVLKKGLKDNAYEVEVAHDGQTAARLFAEMKPDLVLLDYHLPDTTGENLLQTFATQKPRPVVVMMTADPDPDLAVKWMKQGAAAYVRKPFKVEYLAALCAALLRERHFLNIEDLLEERTRQLRESEERYRRITQGITDYIYTVQVKNAKVVKTTHGPGCVAVTGYSEEEFAADAYLWHRMVSAEDRPRVEGQAQRLIMGEDALPIEHRIIRKDGALRWVSNIPVVHRGLDGRVLNYDGLIRDITERKMIEDALQESENRYRTIVENTNDAIYIHDFEGNIIDVNENACRMLGYERDDLVGANLAKIDTRWRVPENKELEQLLRDGSNVFERENVRRDGSVVPVEVSTKIVGREGRGIVQAFARDITERKRAEEQILRQHQELQLVLDSVVAGIWYLDTHGRVVKWNHVAERSSRMTSSQVRGQTIHTLAPTWDDPDRRHRESLSVAVSGQPLLGSIESFRTNGEVRWVRVDKVPWKDIHGTIIGVLLFIYDITDLKRTEEERENLVNSLRDALDKVKTLRGLLPICASCKKIRNDKGYWEQIEVYVRDRSEAQFTHGICPDCAKNLYPELQEK